VDADHTREERARVEANLARVEAVRRRAAQHGEIHRVGVIGPRIEALRQERAALEAHLGDDPRHWHEDDARAFQQIDDELRGLTLAYHAQH
jgi:hypothetical protein